MFTLDGITPNRISLRAPATGTSSMNRNGLTSLTLRKLSPYAMEALVAQFSRLVMSGELPLAVL